MVYQVYLNWKGNQYDGREILVFPNRQYADEFYNRCVTTLASGTSNPLDDVVRHSPQFWSFSMNAESRPFYFIQSNAKDLVSTTMVARINGYDNNHATGAMPIIPNDPTSNVEYRSGGSFYIRTKSTPHLYWYLRERTSSRVHLDPRKATKFQITQDDPTDQANDKRVLERKDLVRLTALTGTGSYDVGVVGHTVMIMQFTYKFRFGSFYNQNLGVDWTIDDEPFLAFQVPHAGEQWELIN